MPNRLSSHWTSPPPEWAIPAPDARSRSGTEKRNPLKLTALRRALANAVLETRYQPMVCISDSRPLGMEALVRLPLSRQGMLVPGDFLPQVEAAGLSAVLTDAMAKLAFADWASLTVPTERLMLSINLPLDVLLCPVALAQLEERRQAAGLAATTILIELTESRPVDDLQGLKRSLSRIKDVGYAIALDDVTPTLPQLRHLLAMPFDTLKLDKGVVCAAPEHADAATFVARLVQHAHAGNMTVTAEGVENETVWKAMQGLGVDAAQGYLIGEPLHAVSISGWLEDWPERVPH